MSFPSNIHRLGAAIQTTKGTAAATVAHVFYTTGGTIAPVEDRADFEETTENRLRVGSYIARARSEGNPAAYARPSMLGALLYGAMGAKSVTGAGPYVHVFTLAATQPYMTFFRNLGGLIFERFVDCKITNLTLASVEGGPLTVTMNVLGLAGQHLTADPVTSPAAETTHPFLHYDTSGALLVENTDVASIRSVSIAMSLGGTVQPGNVVSGVAVTEGMVDITITTEQLVTDRNLWNRLHYGSASPANNAPQTTTPLTLGGAPAGIDFLWTRGTNSLRVAATNLQVMNITGIEPSTGNDPYRMSVTYKVDKPASGSGLTATLTNSTATYTPS